MCSEEIEERQLAELEFVTAAYNPEEAWVHTSCVGDGHHRKERNIIPVEKEVRRQLKLAPTGTQVDTRGMSSSLRPSSTEVSIELRLTMPIRYPVDESSPLSINASVCSGLCPVSRKIAIDAIPNLLKACRAVAEDYVGQEAVFGVLSRADEWVDNDWHEFAIGYNRDKYSHRCLSGRDYGIERDCLDDANKKNIALARKLIYSHHIIAKNKRKAIADLSRDYQLGGFTKIGWPGIIIIEGEEGNCDSFIDEIRTMRWQHLVVRGEELTRVSISRKDGNIDEHRRLPSKMEELGDDEMSDLASRCRTAGLEDLFKTSMKMYRKHQTVASVKDGTETNCGDIDVNMYDKTYSILLHIDHMNDRKSYEQWIRKACKSAGCSYTVKQCFKNDIFLRRPIIFAFLIGDEDSIKQVMKRWRTSRVDVDAKGKPCLERMMSVLVEGETIYNRTIMESMDESKLRQSRQNHNYTSIDHMKEYAVAIGGKLWESAILQTIG